MRRNLGLAILVFSLLMVFLAGCSKKEVLKEDVGVKGQATEAKPVEKAAPAEKAKAKKATVGESTTEGAEKAAKEKKAAAGKAEKAAAVPARELYELADIHFDFDKFNLKDETRAILKQHAEWLNKNKDVMIEIEGHCDERGTAEYNLALGERRANAAAKFLIDLGVDEKRIKTISYGEERPLDPGHNEAAWAKNRRAHFVAAGKK